VPAERRRLLLSLFEQVWGDDGQSSRSDPAATSFPTFKLRQNAMKPDRDLAVPRAGATGLEPATSGVTGRRSNQLSYAPEGWAAGALGQVFQGRWIWRRKGPPWDLVERITRRRRDWPQTV
jgi:hypothetical protein